MFLQLSFVSWHCDLPRTLSIEIFKTTSVKKESTRILGKNGRFINNTLYLRIFHYVPHASTTRCCRVLFLDLAHSSTKIKVENQEGPNRYHPDLRPSLFCAVTNMSISRVPRTEDRVLNVGWCSFHSMGLVLACLAARAYLQLHFEHQGDVCGSGQTGTVRGPDIFPIFQEERPRPGPIACECTSQSCF